MTINIQTNKKGVSKYQKQKIKYAKAGEKIKELKVL